jgi:hypothetical protein
MLYEGRKKERLSARPFTPGVEKRQNSDPFQAGKRKSAGLFFWRFCATR